MERKKKMSTWLVSISLSLLAVISSAQQDNEDYAGYIMDNPSIGDDSGGSLSLSTTQSPPGAKTRLCRNRYSWMLNESAFHWDSCVQCYSFIPEDLFWSTTKMNYTPRHPGCLLRDTNETRNNMTISERFCLSDAEDRQVIEATVKTVKGMALWKDCCEAAQRCCQHMTNSNYTGVTIDGPHCKRLWDGWACIPDTAAGITADVPCPAYIYFYTDPPPEGCVNYGSRICDQNGSWGARTEYGTCGQTAILRKRLLVNVAAFGVSLVFLVPAVIIFMSYKQLRVPRITMHTNLFLSLIANGVVVILYKSVISLNVLDQGSNINGIVDQNSVTGLVSCCRVNGQGIGKWKEEEAGCKFALVLTKYTRMTSYMWMFCEGFYLHKLIVAAFAEQKRLIIYYILGWVGPIFPVTLYALIRHYWSDEKCWMFPYGNYEWIINAPMLLSLALNLTFLCNIIRVLITKLRAAHAQEPSQYRKAVRATVVLVPLFGLHFLLTIYLPGHGGCGAIEYYYYYVAVEFYYYFSNVTDGLQGFLVSLIFCYSNGEILGLLARSFNTFRLQQKLGSQRYRTGSCRHAKHSVIVSSTTAA